MQIIPNRANARLREKIIETYFSINEAKEIIMKDINLNISLFYNQKFITTKVMIFYKVKILEIEIFFILMNHLLIL